MYTRAFLFVLIIFFCVSWLSFGYFFIYPWFSVLSSFYWNFVPIEPLLTIFGIFASTFGLKELWSYYHGRTIEF